MAIRFVCPILVRCDGGLAQEEWSSGKSEGVRSESLELMLVAYRQR